MTAFPPVNYKLLKCKHFCTGMPIRPEFYHNKLLKKDATAILNHEFSRNFKVNLKTVLIFGGSQGATTINRIVPEIIATFGKENIQIIHLTGCDDIDKIQKFYSINSITNIVLKSYDKMALLYSSADFVISRSGGSTVSELFFFKKPAALIPYPFACDLHQNFNAEILVKSGLGKIIDNLEHNGEKLQKVIAKLMNDEITLDKGCSLPDKMLNSTTYIIKLLNDTL